MLSQIVVLLVNYISLFLTYDGLLIRWQQFCLNSHFIFIKFFCLKFKSKFFVRSTKNGGFLLWYWTSKFSWVNLSLIDWWTYPYIFWYKIRWVHIFILGFNLSYLKLFTFFNIKKLVKFFRFLKWDWITLLILKLHKILRNFFLICMIITYWVAVQSPSLLK